MLKPNGPVPLAPNAGSAAVILRPTETKPRGSRRCLTFPDRTAAKGVFAMIYGEPETSRFLVAVQRLKREQRRKERQTRLAKQRIRVSLRKMRPC